MGVPPVVIREAVRSDIPQITKLLKPLYGYRRDKDFFVWQCFENIRSAVLVVAQESQAIVGMLGVQEVRTNNGLIGGQISWINIAEHKRGSGLFSEMGNRALGHFMHLDFIFVFANKSAVNACKKSFGMTFIGELDRLILDSIYFEADVTLRIETIRTDTVFDSIPQKSNLVSFQRDAEYRRWRYSGSTEYQYFKFSLPSGEYVVTKLFQPFNSQEPIVGDIVDCECDLSDNGRLRQLFRSACFHLKQMGASCVSTWAVEGTPLSGVLREIGFSGSHHNSFFGINVFQQKYKDLYNYHAWHIVQSDATNY
jgi:hypothetical protein